MRPARILREAYLIGEMLAMLFPLAADYGFGGLVLQRPVDLPTSNTLHFYGLPVLPAPVRDAPPLAKVSFHARGSASAQRV